MTPDQEKELDECLAGLAGETKPKSGTGFDELDAHLAEGMRRLDRRWQAEPAEVDIARVWSRIRQGTGSRRRVTRPFASGIAAGVLLALGGAFAFQALREVDPNIGYKSGEPAALAASIWFTVLPSPDAHATAMQLIAALEQSSRAFALEYDAGKYTVQWLIKGTPRDSEVTAWLRSQGIIVPAGTEEILILISPAKEQ